RRNRRAILIKPDEGAIEIVAREVEIVGIATEERHYLLRREDQTHIGIFAVDVELILAALLERGQLTAELRLAHSAAFLFDSRDGTAQACSRQRREKVFPHDALFFMRPVRIPPAACISRAH